MALNQSVMERKKNLKTIPNYRRKGQPDPSRGRKKGREGVLCRGDQRNFSSSETLFRRRGEKCRHDRGRGRRNLRKTEEPPPPIATRGKEAFPISPRRHHASAGRGGRESTGHQVRHSPKTIRRTFITSERPEAAWRLSHIAVHPRERGETAQQTPGPRPARIQRSQTTPGSGKESLNKCAEGGNSKKPEAEALILRGRKTPRGQEGAFSPNGKSRARRSYPFRTREKENSCETVYYRRGGKELSSSPSVWGDVNWGGGCRTRQKTHGRGVPESRQPYQENSRIEAC